MSNSDNNAMSTAVDSSKLLSASALSVGGAAVANAIAYFFVNLFYDAPAGFAPLTLPPILIFTVVGTSLGALVFWFLSRRSATPVRTYRIVALIALIVSIVPNIAAYFNPSLFPIPGGEPAAFLVLILFHVVAAVVSVSILTTRSTYQVN